MPNWHKLRTVRIITLLKKRLVTHKRATVKHQKRTVTLKKMSLHDTAHHSFVFGLSGDELFKMMTAMTAQHCFEMHGEYQYPERLDKSKVSFRSLKNNF